MADVPAEPNAEERIERLLQRMNVLPEPAMRLTALTETIRSADDEEAVTLLGGLLDRAARRPSRDHRGALSLIPGDELARRLGYERVTRLYRIARGRGLNEVCHLFLAGASRHLEPDERVIAAPRGETLTLGQRKELARRLPREKIERLLLDPDPAVVENLLRNPAMTEREVLKVASRRPVHPDVLMKVFRNTRWSNRYRVRKALVYNPYTPIQVALTLVTFMQSGDLNDLARDPGVHAWIRDRARAVLRDRPGGHGRRGEAKPDEAAERAAAQALGAEPPSDEPESA